MTQTPEPSKLDQIVADSEAQSHVQVYAILDEGGSMMHYAYIDVFAGETEAQVAARAFEEYQEYVISGYDMATQQGKASSLIDDAHSVRFGAKLSNEQFMAGAPHPAKPAAESLSEPIAINHATAPDLLGFDR